MLETLLTQKVKDRIASKKITDYKEVVQFFADRFRDLTANITAMDDSVVDVINLEKEKASFFELFEYKLELKEGDTIAVLKGAADKREIIGEILFKNGYSIARFKGESEDHLLTYHTVDQFFNIAFEPLLD